MVTGLLHTLVRHARVYDLVQRLVGAQRVHRRIAARLCELPTPRRVLDLGGGTGTAGALFPGAAYVCLDIDLEKLRGFRAKSPGGLVLLGDGTRPPVATGSVDLVLVTAVSHHLEDDLLPRLFHEVARVLGAQGSLLFMDAVWNPRRWAGRLLWRYDRGSHPRRAEALRALVAAELEVVSWEQFSIFHEYVICVARPRHREAAPHGA